ncbi:MAG: hypothetical protein M3Y39_03205, partial [Chloroflexota bacterium]|nr:hypothetical protein [Chloroflexota bacterium]
MMNLTDPKGTQTFSAPTAVVAERWSNAHIWQRVGAIVWSLGFILLIVCSVIVHSHPGPWPFDLQTSLYVQGLHLWAWVIA